MSAKSETTGPCPVIEGLMSVRLTAPDEDHPAIDTAIRELIALRRELRRAGEWDEYHPAYLAGARAAFWMRDNPRPASPTGGGPIGDALT